MFRNIRLERPLAVIDLETTGLDTATARIVELCVLTAHADGSQVIHVWRLDPGAPIPATATAIHGIQDADVAGSPLFEHIAAEVLMAMHQDDPNGADWCGWNLIAFDLAVLQNELRRCGRALSFAGRPELLDPIGRFHRAVPYRPHRPRDLAAAVRYYCDRGHHGAHGALQDVLAVVDVLDAQVGLLGLPGPLTVTRAGRWLRCDDDRGDGEGDGDDDDEGDDEGAKAWIADPPSEGARPEGGRSS